MTQVRKARQWVISHDDYESEDDFRQAVVSELAGLENLGHRTGGAYIATPIRQGAGQPHIDGVDEFEVVAWVFQQQFMPAARAVEPVVADEADELPDLALVGAQDANDVA
jgi:hypothetical protein